METAAEIAMQLKKANENPYFCYIDSNDPFENPPAGIWPIRPTKKRKYKQIERILMGYDISCEYIIANPIENGEEERIKNSISLANYEELTNLKWDDIQIGSGVLSHLITTTSNPYPDLIKYRKEIENGVLCAISVARAAKELIFEKTPDEIIIFNGRFATVWAINQVAEAQNVRIRYFEEASTFRKFNIFERFPFDLSYIRYDINSAWGVGGKNKEKTAQDFFVRQRAGKQERANFANSQMPGLIPQKKRRRISYFSSSDDEFVCMPIKNTYGVSPIFKSQRNAINFLIKWAESQLDVEFVIRVHPHVSKKSKDDRNFWNNLNGRNVNLIESLSVVDSYALAESSDLVLSYGSTIGIEATYWGAPSVSLCRSAYEEQGCTYEPKSEVELLTMLTEYLPPLPKENCYPYAYWVVTNGSHEYFYYQPSSPTRGLFCGERLSMDFQIVDRIKYSNSGRWLKEMRDIVVKTIREKKTA